MAASSEGVGVVFGGGVALVVVERDRLLLDVEDDVAISAVVVLPTTVSLFENVLGQALDGLGDADGRTLRLRLVPNDLGDFDDFARHGDGIVAGLSFEILDLAGIAVA